MSNKYLNYISDEHFLSCIAKLHNSYLNAKNRVTKKKFYKNKIDHIKLTFDAKFNSLEEEDLIEAEILRQIDKSINNSIGSFHENILGGVMGYESGNFSGYDLKASDNTMFADIKNKHNTMNSSSAESLFQKLARFADDNKQAKCYWVQVLATKSFNELWKGDINGKEYSHSRVYKISGDRFYELVTGEKDAFFTLYKALPYAIDDYMTTLNFNQEKASNSAIEEIRKSANENGLSLLDQISFDNYNYYSGYSAIE